MDPQKLTKGERTHRLIIEAAFRSIAHRGYHATTFQTIADEAGFSQPLIVKHFGSREEIFPKALEFFLHQARQLTAAALKEGQQSLRASELLRRYLEISFEIVLSNPDMKSFYVTFYFLSFFDQRIRKENEEVKRQAIRRIEGIIQRGVESGEFKPRVSPNQAARTIHNALTGSVMNWLVEPPEGKGELLESLFQFANGLLI